MKLTSRQDIEAPISFVFAALQDFEAWERLALRRGAEVSRTDKLGQIVAGMSWMIKFAYRSKPRRVALRLTRIEAPMNLAFAGSGASLEGLAGIDLLALTARRTRLSVTLDLRPKTIGMRLVLQSMRLAKGRVNRRLADRVEQFCAEIESKHRHMPRS